MKIYNIFTFFNEIELLKFRIDYLKNVVDYFVIVEADESFSGIPKKQNFCLDDFDPEVRSKIRYSYISYPNEIDFPVKITEKGNPNNRRAWAREWYSRSRLSDGLYDAEPEDMIILSDVDEVMYQELLQKTNWSGLSNLLEEHKVIDLSQYVFHYNIKIGRAHV
jgi:beta-1,4-mannosyl-glycoprotein beta-1,4-N-acetylglucosaminyltransferase